MLQYCALFGNLAQLIVTEALANVNQPEKWGVLHASENVPGTLQQMTA